MTDDPRKLKRERNTARAQLGNANKRIEHLTEINRSLRRAISRKEAENRELRAELEAERLPDYWEG